MTNNKENIVIKIAETDNVCVAANTSGLPKSARLKNGIEVLNFVRMGHKIALKNISEGEKILRYGHVIGYAKNHICAGKWVNETNINLPIQPDLNSIQLTQIKPPKTEPLKDYTFMGYRNKNGSVGTKNVLGIVTSVQCVA